MSITSITLPNGATIETSAPISDLLPLFMQEPTVVPAVPQPKAVEVTARTTEPKARQPRKAKATVAPKAPSKATTPKQAEVTVFDRKATYSAIMQEAKTDPDAAKQRAAELGWTQVVETIERRQTAKLSKAPKATAKVQEPKAPAEPVIQPAPPAKVQRQQSRQVRRTRKVEAAMQETVAMATAKAEAPEVLPTPKAARTPKLATDWQARRTVRSGQAVCLGCMSDAAECVCKSSAKCREAADKAFVSTSLARQYPNLPAAELRSLVELELALRAA